MARAINFAGFYVAWFACVWGGAAHHPWWGPAIAAPWVAWHVSTAPRPRSELALLASVTLLGTLIDSTLSAWNWYRFADPWCGGRVCPPWMISLWAVFGTTLRSSLGWLQGRWVWAAVLGGISGPASYWAGQRLGAIELGPPFVETLLVLAGVWAVVVPVSLVLAQSPRPSVGETRE